MRPTDPRFRDYALLQAELCAMLNRECHWNMARLPLDPYIWEAYGREAVADGLRAAMSQLLREGTDD
jgi:hypothetical protein